MDKGGFDIFEDMREDVKREAQAKLDAAKQEHEHDEFRTCLWWRTYNAVIVDKITTHTDIERAHALAVAAAERAHGWKPSHVE